MRKIIWLLPNVTRRAVSLLGEAHGGQPGHAGPAPGADQPSLSAPARWRRRICRCARPVSRLASRQPRADWRRCAWAVMRGRSRCATGVWVPAPFGRPQAAAGSRWTSATRQSPLARAGEPHNEIANAQITRVCAPSQTTASHSNLGRPAFSGQLYW